MLRSRTFSWGLLICGLSYGSTMIFGLSGAFIIEHQLHYSPVAAGYAALMMGLAWMCGGFIGKATLQKSFLPKLKTGNVLHVVLSVQMIVSALLMYNIDTLIIFAFFIHVCGGFIFNNYFAYCLGRFPQMAGVASGFSGGANYIITSVASYMAVSLLHPKEQSDLGYGYLVMGLLMLFILHFMLKPKSGASPN